METATTYEVAQPPAQVTAEDVDNLMSAALYDGIGYWCSFGLQSPAPEGINYLSDALTRGGTIVLHDHEDGNVYYLTLDKFLVGLAKACAFRKQSVERFIDEHDAIEADILVQFAVLGEIVYG